MKPDFISLADEIAEPHPGMNMKVAAFTVNEKSTNTLYDVRGAFNMLWKQPTISQSFIFTHFTITFI